MHALIGLIGWIGWMMGLGHWLDLRGGEGRWRWRWRWRCDGDGVVLASGTYQLYTIAHRHRSSTQIVLLDAGCIELNVDG